MLALASVLAVAHLARATVPGLRGAEIVAQQVAWLRRVAPDSAARMQELFPEGEFFTWALTGLAAGSLARQGIDREEHLALLDEAITRTGRPEVAHRFGSHPEPLRHGAFFHGWRLLLLTEQAALTGDPAHRAEMSDQAEAVVSTLAETPFPTSYPGEAWPCDVVVALAAAHRADAVSPVPRLAETTELWFAAAREHRDPDTGLLVHRVGEHRARATSQSIIQVFLPDVDAELAGREWPRFKEHFLTRELGLVGIREHAHGVDGVSDVDSGPLVAGVSLSASAVTLAAARRNGDLELATVLDREAELFGVPLPLPGGRASALGLLPVGDAFLAWARSVELGPDSGAPRSATLVVAVLAGCVVSRWHRGRAVDFRQGLWSRKDEGVRTRVVEIDGLQVVARVHGSGPRTYVLVHGLGMSSYYFRPLAERLGRRGTVFSLNLPGFGPTRDPDRTLRVAQFAQVAGRAADRLGVSAAVWVGHSMGSQIATEVALQRPDLVERLVLLAPVVNEAENHFLKVCLRFTQAAVHETLPSVLATARGLLGAGPRYVAEMVPALLSHPLRRRLGEVTVPVTLVVGELDALTPPDWVRQLRECNPRVSSHTVFGASHQMMHTHADETVAVIAAAEPPPWRPRWRQIAGELLRGIRPGRRVRSGPNGIPVLLLPGILERSGYLWRLANRLGATGHQVLTVPQLGWNLGSLADAVQAARIALGDRRDVVLVAHSKGGLIGKKLLLEAGDQLAGMVAVATPFNGSDLVAGLARSPLLRRTPLRLFDPGSAELQELAADHSVNHRIVSLNPTRDPLIPAGSHLPGAINIRLPQIGHFAPVLDEQVWALIIQHIAALRESSALSKEPPCSHD